MQEMNYKDFYRKEVVENMQPLVVAHSLNKFEEYQGVVEITKEGVPQLVGVKSKDVLEKTLKYYNNQPQQSAVWFYVSDLRKSMAKQLTISK